MMSTIAKQSCTLTTQTAEACTFKGQKFATITAILLITNLQGCSTLSTIATGPIGTGLSVVSFVTTGKGLLDHALDFVSDQDCRLLEGLMKDDRNVCEPEGSIATSGDFKGFIALNEFDEDEIDIKRLNTAEQFALHLSLSTDQTTIHNNSELAQPYQPAPSLEMDYRIQRTPPRVAGISIENLEKISTSL